MAMPSHSHSSLRPCAWGTRTPRPLQRALEEMQAGTWSGLEPGELGSPLKQVRAGAHSREPRLWTARWTKVGSRRDDVRRGVLLPLLTPCLCPIPLGWPGLASPVPSEHTRLLPARFSLVLEPSAPSWPSLYTYLRCYPAQEACLLCVQLAGESGTPRLRAD